MHRLPDRKGRYARKDCPEIRYNRRTDQGSQYDHSQSERHHSRVLHLHSCLIFQGNPPFTPGRLQPPFLEQVSKSMIWVTLAPLQPYRDCRAARRRQSGYGDRACKSGSGLHGAGFVLPADLDELRDIQQIIQGIGPVPEFMLFPVAKRYRQEQELINVRAGYGDIVASAGGAFDPPSPKKPSSAQAISSSTSFIQETVSCFSSGYPHSDPVMTGFGPAGSSTDT